MYRDSDWAGDVDTRRSTTSWISILNGGPIAWLSQKQLCVTLSTTETKFLHSILQTKETVYLRKFLGDLNFDQKLLTRLYCDNQAVIKLVTQAETLD